MKLKGECKLKIVVSQKLITTIIHLAFTQEKKLRCLGHPDYSRVGNLLCVICSFNSFHLNTGNLLLVHQFPYHLVNSDISS
jgi:hypothetical protein